MLNSPNTLQTKRVIGYDLARAIAFLGMLVVNFSGVTGVSDADPGWLIYAIEIINGRAAATFVVLAGVGLSLLSKRACQSNDKLEINAIRCLLLKRALFLLIIGLLNVMMSPLSDILHFYAVYLALGAWLLTVSNQSLWLLSVVTMASRPLLVTVFIFLKNWGINAPATSGCLKLPAIIGHIFLNGCFPVVPWMAFIMIGIWIGRQDLSKLALRKKILLAGICAVGVAESIPRLVTYMYSLAEVQIDFAKLIPCVEVVAWNPIPLFMISAIGTALIVISLSMMLADRCGNLRWLAPHVSVGQTVLTLYVAHIVVSIFCLNAIEILEMEFLLFPIWATTLFYSGALLFSHYWLKRFRKGPLELLMRRFLVFTKASKTSLQPEATL